MFANTGNPIPASTLEALRASTEHEFYLTGSRRFGNATNTSDYDFFTADSPTIRSYLRGLGFMRRNTGSYGQTLTDVALVEVWSHVRDRIDIQIRNNVEEFEAVCRMVEASGTLPPTDKLTRKSYWNMMITAVRQAKRLTQGTSDQMRYCTPIGGPR